MRRKSRFLSTNKRANSTRQGPKAQTYRFRDDAAVFFNFFDLLREIFALFPVDFASKNIEQLQPKQSATKTSTHPSVAIILGPS